MKKIVLLSCCTAFACSCSQKKEVPQPIEVNTDNEMYLLVGTYTSGSSTGVYVYDFNTETGDSRPVSEVRVSNPSYLTISADEQLVYTVSENPEAEDSVSAFTFDKASGTLNLLNKEATKGKHPCYININRSRTFVATANYTGGNLSVFPLSNDGSLQPVSQVLGFDPPKEVKDFPVSHLHSIVFSPDEKYAFAADLGKDKIHKFEVNDEGGESGLFLKPGEPAAFDLEKGSGPRHLVFHPNGNYLYCINELSGKITVFSYSEGNLSAVQYISSDTTSGKERKGSADIHLSPDGRFLYASNRLKADGIAIFSVNPDDGKLTSAGYQSTGVHPRNFTLTPDGNLLLVANRDSNNIQIFTVNFETGLLQDTGKKIVLDKPVCLKWIYK